MNDKGRAPVLADLHIRSCDVIDVLAGLMVIRGAPGEIWPDNGPNAWILNVRFANPMRRAIFPAVRSHASPRPLSIPVLLYVTRFRAHRSGHVLMVDIRSMAGGGKPLTAGIVDPAIPVLPTVKLGWQRWG